MGWEAQAAAGVGFLVVGFLHGFKQIRSYRLQNSRSYSFQDSSTPRRKSWYHDIELYIILVFALSHVITDEVVSRIESGAQHPVAVSVNAQRSVVAINFLFYALVTLIVDNTKWLPVPPQMISLLALSAFVQEFLLFYFQRDGAGLESQYHYLLLVPIGVCAGSTAAEIAYPNALLPPVIRSMGLILQGTWFIQIAVSVFGSTWISQGCSLKEDGEGDYTVICEGMNLMRGQGIATLQFNCHLALLLVLLLPSYAVMCKIYTSPQHYQPLGDSEGNYEPKELTQLRDTSRISPHYMQSDQFHVIQEDEELEEPTPRRGSTDSNGFHTMVI